MGKGERSIRETRRLATLETFQAQMLQMYTIRQRIRPETTLHDPQLANMPNGKDLNIFSAETLKETTLNVSQLVRHPKIQYLHFPRDSLYIFVPISQEIKSESFGNSG
jgi:hypothetical protein